MLQRAVSFTGLSSTKRLLPSSIVPKTTLILEDIFTVGCATWLPASKKGVADVILGSDVQAKIDLWYWRDWCKTIS